MRLLEHNNDGELSLTQFFDNIPRYAILSHTWGPEEVTFTDLIEGSGISKAGYDKIRFCGEQARRDGLQYFWVDTCCIDKSSSTELTEAINSMFRWYRDAAKCYVFLADVPRATVDSKGQPNQLPWESAFRTSRWFTRGWTLQELLAPSSVEFFMKDGQRLGDRRSLEQQIHEITGIAVPALRGSALDQFDIEERFKWAKSRQTTREEDWAYCLLGIFGIFMTLIYGEGKTHAICRLRMRINKKDTPTPSASNSVYIGPELALTVASSGDPYRQFLLQQTYHATIWKSAVSPSGNRFVTSEDQNIYIWMANDAGEFHITQNVSICGTITALSISPDGGTFAFVGNQTLQLWSDHCKTKMLKQDTCYRFNAITISTAAFSLEGNLLAMSRSEPDPDKPDFDCSPRGKVYGFQVWEVDRSSGQPHWQVVCTVRTVEILDLGFTPAEERLVCVSPQEIQIRKRIGKTTFQVIHKLCGDAYGGFRSFATSPNGDFLAVACSQHIVMWESDGNGGFRRIPHSSPGGVLEAPISFASDGHRLASCPYSGPVKEAFIQIWQLKWKADGRWCKEIEQQLCCNKSRVQRLAFLSDGRLISVSRDGVRIWKKG
jgi:WD40 repeat protein